MHIASKALLLLFLAIHTTKALEEAPDAQPLSTFTLRDDLDRATGYIFDTFSSGLEENRQTVLRPELKLRERVPLPADNPTASFWLDTPGANPLAEEGSKGKLTDDADVCVIGSGITGVSTAWHLSKMLSEDAPASQGNLSVVVFEARQFCSGATGRNGGHLTRNVFSSFLARQAADNHSEAVKSYLLEQYSANALVRFVADKNLQNEVDLVEGGHVTVFRTDEEETEARRDWEAARDAGLDVNVTWIGNDEMTEKYGLSHELNYTGVSFAGHNVWPCKLVTHLFKDSQSISSNVDISLHTRTPVTAITRDFWPLSAEKPHASTSQDRRWKLHTPRGGIACNYVVHATNAYASHLLPFLAGIEENADQPSPSFSAGGGRPPPGEEHPPQQPHPRPPPEPALPSRGLYGIVPTRGQVGAVRAAVGPSELEWHNSWDGGGGGWEYWFPRYQDINASGNDTGVASRNPLIILGGGREFSGGRLEAGVADDASVNPLVSKALRTFLPRFFPEQFAAPAVASGQDEHEHHAVPEDAWEMEWTGIMGFTKGGDPIVGPVVLPQEFSFNTKLNTLYEGQYIAAGYTGHGMPRAYACAEVVAGMIKAQITGEAWAKPTWLPERYLSWAAHP